MAGFPCTGESTTRARCTRPGRLCRRSPVRRGHEAWWQPPRPSIDSNAVSRTATDLVADIEGRLRPCEVDLARAWRDASTKSSPEADRLRAEAALARRSVLADSAVFTE